jgi:phosphoribosyl-ATP pyrophosphohydrolase/phosphoribosyl-AMP cyclohydrolase
MCEIIPYDELCLDKCADGLLPVVVQDAATLKVLMLGYMNREAYEKTIAEGCVTFYSRTRGELWTKGETSGHYLMVESVYVDCDKDALLVKATPIGPTCHRGTTSCFDTPESEGFIRKLQKVVENRHKEMPEGSYTTLLFNKGVKKMAQKVGEEAVETVIEAIDGNKERYVYEVCDLLYHTFVLNEHFGVSLEDLEKELLDRHS